MQPEQLPPAAQTIAPVTLVKQKQFGLLLQFVLLPPLQVGPAVQVPGEGVVVVVVVGARVVVVVVVVDVVVVGAAQTPPPQTWPGAQHAPLQGTFGQAHTPSSHVWLAAQVEVQVVAVSSHVRQAFGSHVGAPPPHSPAWQDSPVVQKSPSSQAVPSDSGVKPHTPMVQTPAPWQRFGSPAWQTMPPASAQPPQLFSSVKVSRQKPPQQVRPSWQSLSPVVSHARPTPARTAQAPPMQIWPAGQHAAPQVTFGQVQVPAWVQVSLAAQAPQLATGWPQLLVVGPHVIPVRAQAWASVSGVQTHRPPVQTSPVPGQAAPLSTWPSQSSSAPLHTSVCACWFWTQTMAPLEHWVVPAAQMPGRPVLHARPTPVGLSSIAPSQSSSRPLHVSGRGC